MQGLVVCLISNEYDGENTIPTHKKDLENINELKKFENIIELIILENKTEDELLNEITLEINKIENKKNKDLLIIYSGHGNEYKYNFLPNIVTNDYKNVPINNILNVISTDFNTITNIFTACRSIMKEDEDTYTNINKINEDIKHKFMFYSQIQKGEFDMTNEDTTEIIQEIVNNILNSFNEKYDTNKYIETIILSIKLLYNKQKQKIKNYTFYLNFYDEKDEKDEEDKENIENINNILNFYKKNKITLFAGRKIREIYPDLVDLITELNEDNEIFGTIIAERSEEKIEKKQNQELYKRYAKEIKKNIDILSKEIKELEINCNKIKEFINKSQLNEDNLRKIQISLIKDYKKIKDYKEIYTDDEQYRILKKKYLDEINNFDNHIKEISQQKKDYINQELQFIELIREKEDELMKYYNEYDKYLNQKIKRLKEYADKFIKRMIENGDIDNDYLDDIGLDLIGGNKYYKKYLKYKNKYIASRKSN